jgi:hypothetical protein
LDVPVVTAAAAAVVVVVATTRLIVRIGDDIMAVTTSMVAASRRAASLADVATASGFPVDDGHCCYGGDVGGGLGDSKRRELQRDFRRPVPGATPTTTKEIRECRRRKKFFARGTAWPWIRGLKFFPTHTHTHGAKRPTVVRRNLPD